MYSRLLQDKRSGSCGPPILGYGQCTPVHIPKFGTFSLPFREGQGGVSVSRYDFLRIPADVPHQPVNLSDTEEVIAVVARNDPNEQESVVVIEIPSAGAGLTE